MATIDMVCQEAGLQLQPSMSTKGKQNSRLNLYRAAIFLLIAGILLSPVTMAHLARAHAGSDFDDVLRQVQSDYQAIHQNPEVGKQEIKTAQYVRQRLQQIGYKTFLPVKSLPTAVIAVLDTGRPGTTVCLRAELDARPGQEQTGLPFASKVEGLMHSCGHDAHTAMLLGAADLLFRQRELLTGRIVFLFQPAEETAGGADDIVAEGVLDSVGVKYIFAQHVAPGLPVGTVEISPGPVMAGSNYFTIKLTGRGSHAAAPQSGDDVLLAAAEMAADLTRLPARKLDVVNRPAIISVTYINAGRVDAANVLPPDAELRGTVRSFEDIDREYEGQASIRQVIEQYVSGTAQALSVKAEVALRKGAPPTVNNAEAYRKMIDPLRTRWTGQLRAASKTMFAEDFAYYTPRYSALYFSLGVTRDGLGMEPVHSNKFTLHPDALGEGLRLLVLLAQIGTRN